MSEGVGYPDLVRAWSETCGRAVDWLAGVGVASRRGARENLVKSKERNIPRSRIQEDVGTRAVATLKARFERLGGRHMNSIEAFP